MIANHVDSCLKHVIRNTQFPRQLKDVEFRVKTTRSKDLRVSISSYLLLMLREWPPTSIDRVVGHVGGMIEVRSLGRGIGATASRAERGCSTGHDSSRDL